MIYARYLLAKVSELSFVHGEFLVVLDDGGLLFATHHVVEWLVVTHVILDAARRTLGFTIFILNLLFTHRLISNILACVLFVMLLFRLFCLVHVDEPWNCDFFENI